jgi:hypothetical protein
VDVLRLKLIQHAQSARIVQQVTREDHLATQIVALGGHDTLEAILDLQLVRVLDR